MSPELLQDAIGGIDDAFIDEAANATGINPKVWLPAASLAACILLTVALLPWKTMLSVNDPSKAPPPDKDPTSDFLWQDDTTEPDSTKDEDDSTVKDSDEITQPPYITEPDNGDSDVAPPQTLPTTPDTTGPYPPAATVPDTDDTDGAEKDTVGPVVPDKPPAPDHGVTIPQRPTVLSRSRYPVQDPYPTEYSLIPKWRSAKNERINYYTKRIGNTGSFMYRTVSEFFKDSENENLIYSPVSAYMALGMLAESCDGESRQQLLSLLCESDIPSLRTSAQSLWNACYRDDGAVTSVLGSSLWLDSSFTPSTQITDILAENYYASSFYGNTGDGEYDELMRSWINEQTRGALSETVQGSTLDPESVMALMSTVYFEADWTDGFDPDLTRSWTFHSPEGDVTAPFMYKDFVGFLYRGANFRTTYLELNEGGKMWFILPNAGVSPQSLFSDSEAMSFITGDAQKVLSYEDHKAYMWMFLPRFSIDSHIDIGQSLENLGISDIFDPAKADFSTLTDSDISIGSITQSAKISIDESGCEASSVSGGICPDYGDTQPVGVTFDRPFIFVVTSDSGIPMFVGTVNRPDSP
ncbi:MAG: hypothetical protein E7647_07235 [Ruminococcaceae bacterium]|nr:hypothetical protein [Oscillospiraceae bacterium]